jgi:hypothetical protein
MRSGSKESLLNEAVSQSQAEGEAVGFQSFRMRVFWIVGLRPLYKIECFHMLGTPESETAKGTALNFWENAHLAAASRLSAHPTASPPLKKSVSSYCDTVSTREGYLRQFALP